MHTWPGVEILFRGVYQQLCIYGDWEMWRLSISNRPISLSPVSNLLIKWKWGSYLDTIPKYPHPRTIGKLAAAHF